MTSRFLTLSAFFLFLAAPFLHAKESSASKNEARSIIRVNITRQSYNLQRPWEKTRSWTASGIGTILKDNQILITAELVDNYTMIELEKPGSGEKSYAELLFIDYEANLALLKAKDPDFLKDFTPLTVDTSSAVGEHLEVWQFESNGTLMRTDALLTNVAVLPYPTPSTFLLGYQLTCVLQSREGSYILPLIKNDKLAGISIRFESSSQNLYAISAQVIEHFLKETSDGNYHGFPKFGAAFTSTRDPMFRKYIGLDGKEGIYVNEVLTNSPAAKAGILSGDVILKIDNAPVDRDANYNDSQYGKLSIANLITTKHYAGDKIPVEILRDGKTQTLTVELAMHAAESFVSPPYDSGKPPRFIIAGGLLFRELSRSYLQSFGKNWSQDADQRLLYYDVYQSSLFPEGNRRIVFLQGSFPTKNNMGYESLGTLVVTKINNHTILRLEDVIEALKTPVDGFHKIEFLDDPKFIFLDPKTIDEDNQTIQQTFGIPLLQRL